MNVMPELLLDLLQLDLQLLPQLEVEGAERLVEEQRLRPVDDRAGERDALPLAARELARLAVAVPVEAHHPQRLRSPAAPLLSRTLFTRRPYSTFSRTVMCGKSA